MKIIMLSWEYPPRIVGGLSRHVQELSEALVQAGHEIHVVTKDHPHTAEHETVNGVHLHRVKTQGLPNSDFLSDIHEMNFGMIEYAWPILKSGAPANIIHSHEWLTADAGLALKRATGLPLLVTIHATESGRNHGIHTAMQKYIHSNEWRLCYEAWRVIVCSWTMHHEVRALFGVPYDKIDVVPNGVDHQKFQIPPPPLGFRRQFTADFEKIVLFVARLVPEKGAHVLVEAAAKVVYTHRNAKFVIVGRGPMADYLKSQAWDMGIAHKVLFTGYIDDETLLNLYRVASVVAVPSTYEPFGISALEGMAAGVPVVVADTGGLSGIVDHTVTGIKTWPGNPESLAWGILEILNNPGYARWLRDNAYNKVLNVYHWPTIASHTTDIYARIWSQWQSLTGHQEPEAKAPEPPPVPEAPQQRRGKKSKDNPPAEEATAQAPAKTRRSRKKAER